MSADAIVYCLEHLTDYDQFERLCSDVMNQSGYRDIEPLGGSNDRGRDALHVSRLPSSDVTVFAYSVRSDWRQKLHEDCKRIQEEAHELNRLVFACTSSITVTQREAAAEKVQRQFGWTLDVFDIERIRVRLSGDLRHLIAQHPSIFCPPFFPTRGGISIAHSPDTIVVDHAEADHALATWLARRLQIAGYRTWCYGTAPLAGETADASVRTLIEKRAERYLPILSPTSIADVDLIGRVALAGNSDRMVIPCTARPVEAASLPSTVRKTTPAAFELGWASGLKQVLQALSDGGVRASLPTQQGKSIALRSYVPEPVTLPVPEQVFANVFPVEVPDAIQEFEPEVDLTQQLKDELRRRWPFVVASSRLLLAFDDPPDLLPLRPVQRTPEYAWQHYDHRNGKRTSDVVKELVRRSLDVACVRGGLEWCDDRSVFYFPHDDKPQRYVSYKHVDGRSARTGVTGEKSYGRGDSAKPFRYQLGPRFRIGFDEEKKCWASMRIYVRITTRDGDPFEKKGITRRRKKVANSWWNKEWFAKTLALMQALSDGDESICIGTGSRSVRVSTSPLKWECPVSIDYRAVERIGDFQEEMASLRYSDSEEELLEAEEVDD